MTQEMGETKTVLVAVTIEADNQGVLPEDRAIAEYVRGSVTGDRITVDEAAHAGWTISDVVLEGAAPAQ